MTDDNIRMVRADRDAANPNNRRIHVNGSQWAKVYGQTPEMALARADQISRALFQMADHEALAAEVSTLGDQLALTRKALNAVLDTSGARGSYRALAYSAAVDAAEKLLNPGAVKAEQVAPPTAPWPVGAEHNAKREGWLAFFTGRDRESCPFPPARADLQRDFRVGWDAADQHQKENAR